MNRLRHTSAILGSALLLSTVSTAAFAGNEAVENALRRHSELSSFYQGLVNTGVLDELDPNATYTIFAPTNKALAKLSPQQYPCFYSDQCREEAAAILSNHIVAGPLQLGGGPDITAAYSINMEQLSFMQASPARNSTNVNPLTYRVSGQRIVKAEAMGAGHLYEISGVIASPQQKMNVSQYKFAGETQVIVQPQPLPPTTHVVQKKVYYAPDGAPDGVSQRTITTETHY